MKGFARAAVLLGLLVSAPGALRAQAGSPAEKVALGRNYPNPFNPETFIPFRLEAEVFAGGQRPVVSMRIYNVLAQLVAIPILQGSGERLDNVAISWNGTGDYTAYWDGRYRGTEKEAASGVYVYQMTVTWLEGDKTKTQSFSKKMTVVK